MESVDSANIWKCAQKHGLRLDKRMIVRPQKETRCINSIKNGFPIANGFRSLPFVKIHWSVINLVPDLRWHGRWHLKLQSHKFSKGNTTESPSKWNSGVFTSRPRNTPPPPAGHLCRFSELFFSPWHHTEDSSDDCLSSRLLASRGLNL